MASQFVLFHNTALTFFSGCLFLGLCETVKNSLPPNQTSPYIAAAADAQCKITGPQGLGKAHTASYSSIDNTPNSFIAPIAGDNQSRMWDRGLGYFGWIFYASKVYELVDTLFVIAKGRQSSLLQTYHHAGVMLCPWANFRYMVRYT